MYDFFYQQHVKLQKTVIGLIELQNFAKLSCTASSIEKVCLVQKENPSIDLNLKISSQSKGILKIKIKKEIT